MEASEPDRIQMKGITKRSKPALDERFVAGTGTPESFYDGSGGAPGSLHGDVWAQCQWREAHRDLRPRSRGLDTIEVRKTSAPPDAQGTPPSRGVRTWELIQGVQRKYAPTKSLYSCGRYAIPNHNVTMTATPDGVVLAGIKRCNSSTCFKCSASKALDRSERLNKALTSALDRGYHPKMMTLTIPTYKWDCYRQYDVLRKAFTAFSKRTRQELRRKKKCSLQLSYSFDVTFVIQRFQTHLHLHLIYCEASTEDITEEWKNKMFGWWRNAVRKASGSSKLFLAKSSFYVEDVENIDGACNYIFKTNGFEVMGSTLKMGHGGGLSFRELGEHILANPKDETAIALYNDFVQTFSGKTFASLGRGLVQELIAEFDEKNPESDENNNVSDLGLDDLGQENPSISITPDAWAVLNDLRKVDYIIQLVEENGNRPRGFRELERACEYFQSNVEHLREWEIIQRWKDVFSVVG